MVTIAAVSRPSRTLKFDTLFFARRITGFWPVTFVSVSSTVDLTCGGIFVPSM